MKRVLVTGAGGFIGHHCLPFLIQKGYDVHAISTKNLKGKDFQWHQADLLNADEIKSIMSLVRPSHLLHFSWCTTPGIYWTSPENLDWLKASVDLLKEFKKVNGQRVVMAGTCAEYDWRYGYCSENITPLSPKSLYGVCKDTLRQILVSYAKLESLSAAWGRIFFLYGPREHSSRLVASVINDMLAGRPVKSTHGEQIRDFLYVEDVASAFVDLMDDEVSGPVNIASGVPVTIKQIITEISRIIGRPDLLDFGSILAPKNEPPLLVADNTRLSAEVGWKPKYGLNDGLQKTVDWWKGI